MSYLQPLLPEQQQIGALPPMRHRGQQYSTLQNDALPSGARGVLPYTSLSGKDWLLVGVVAIGALYFYTKNQ